MTTFKNKMKDFLRYSEIPKVLLAIFTFIGLFVFLVYPDSFFSFIIGYSFLPFFILFVIYLFFTLFLYIFHLIGLIKK